MSSTVGRVTVHKCDALGHEVRTWKARLRSATPTVVCLEARFNGEEAVVHGLAFRRGDRFLETYYADHGYNVFAIYDVDSDDLKGWYCNVTRPAEIQDDHVRFDDLALDLLVLPDGTTHVLDQDEFDRLPLSPGERVSAQASLEELQNLARQRAGPFAMAG